MMSLPQPVRLRVAYLIVFAAVFVSVPLLALFGRTAVRVGLGHGALGLSVCARLGWPSTSADPHALCRADGLQPLGRLLKSIFSSRVHQILRRYVRPRGICSSGSTSSPLSCHDRPGLDSRQPVSSSSRIRRDLGASPQQPPHVPFVVAADGLTHAGDVFTSLRSIVWLGGYRRQRWSCRPELKRVVNAAESMLQYAEANEPRPCPIPAEIGSGFGTDVDQHPAL